MRRLYGLLPPLYFMFIFRFSGECFSGVRAHCAVGLPGAAKLGASIFWTVLKSINIVGSYVGHVFPARVVSGPRC